MLKIFGTFGPTLHEVDTLVEMIEMGMNGIRLNLSHSSLKQANDWIENLVEAKKQTHKEVDLLIDLKGAEIRLYDLQRSMPVLPGDQVCIPTDFKVDPLVLECLEYGDQVQIDDGKLLFEVKKKEGEQVVLEAIRGGKLQEHKSFSIVDKSVVLPPLSQEDLETLALIEAYPITGIMQPFVRSADDLRLLKAYLERVSRPIKVYAKIENGEGFKHLESLFAYADEIVIARGDLGNAVGLANLPIVQHEIERKCKEHGMPYMVVTQMLDSMTSRGVATRAEVNDVFYAVYDGASSIMLTGEVANSKNALAAMRLFTDIAKNTLEYKREE